MVKYKRSAGFQGTFKTAATLGHHPDERAVVKVEQGKYIGYGYVDPNPLNCHMDQLNDCIRPFEGNRDVQQIIKLYLRQEKMEKIIRF